MAPITRSQTKSIRLAWLINQFKTLLSPFNSPRCCLVHRMIELVDIYQFIEDNFSSLRELFARDHRIWMTMYKKVDELQIDMMSKVAHSRDQEVWTNVKRFMTISSSYQRRAVEAKLV